MPQTPHLSLSELVTLRMHCGMLDDGELLECYHLCLLPDVWMEEVFQRLAAEPAFRELSDGVARDRDRWLGVAPPHVAAQVHSGLYRHAMRMRLAAVKRTVAAETGGDRSGEEFQIGLRALLDCIRIEGSDFGGPDISVGLATWRQVQFRRDPGGLEVHWTLGMESLLGSPAGHFYQVRLKTCLSAPVEAELEGELVVVHAKFPVAAVADLGDDAMALLDIELLWVSPPPP